MRGHLVVMARVPRLGQVKRRLAADIGTLAALNFYRQTTGGLLRRLSQDQRWLTWLAITPDSAAVRPSGLWPFRGRLIGQGRGDLGQRMGRLLFALPSGPMVFIGTDIPDINASHIARAFAVLGHENWVLGPSSDGGYWLIGAKRRPSVRPPFADVRWSSPHTLADTVANLEGGRVAFLEPLDDIDLGADLARWRAMQT